MSKNIKMSPEQIKELQIKYFSDRRIKTLYNEIAAIYNTAIPKGIIKGSGTFSIFYDGKIEFEVTRIRQIIDSIVREEYSDLFTD